MKTFSTGITARHSFRNHLCLRASSSVATLLLASIPAWAEEPSAADTAAARDLAIEGIKLADADRCGQAIDKLSRAEKLRHSPIVLGRLGECLIEVGKIVDGTESLQKLLHEPLPPNAPANLLKARERAQTALEAAKPNLSYLAISVRGPTENISVTVDGLPMSSLLLERERPTDPGEHLVEASAPGYTKASRRLTIGAGEKQEVTLKLAVDPQAAAPRPVTPTSLPAVEASNNKPAAAAPVGEPPMREKPQQATPQSTKTLSYVLMGAGTAVLAGGALFGYLALSEKNDLDGKCPNNVCVSASKGTLDTANNYATVSTILVGSGAAAVALGAVLFFTSSPNHNEHPHAGVQTRPYVGLGQAGLTGSF